MNVDINEFVNNTKEESLKLDEYRTITYNRVNYFVTSLFGSNFIIYF